MSETEMKPDNKTATETLCTRLDELADAVTKGDASLRREYYMSIPAQPHRDADLVLYEAARRLRAAQSVLPDFDTRANQPRPAVQGEPVAYAVFAGNGNIRIWCADPIQVETLRQQYGEALQPLYARPQPASDVAGLVDALEDIAQWSERWTAPGHPIATVARKALAAHSKGTE